MITDFTKLGLTIDKRNRIQTSNAMGFMFLGQNKIRHALSAYAAPGYTVADVGCAYGLDTLTLARGGATVTAIDLDETHLAAISPHLTASQQKRVTLKKAHFPLDSPLEKDKYDAVLIMRLLIFLLPHQLNNAIEQAYTALKPGGKLFVVSATPFSHRWNRVNALYKQHSIQAPHTPFFVENIGDLLPPLKPYFPQHILLFDQCSLTDLLQTHGFTVLEGGYMEEEGTVDAFAMAVRL